MHLTVTLPIFRDYMNSRRPENFSYEGQEVLFDYLEDYGDEWEFDPIHICSLFQEYESPEEAALKRELVELDREESLDFLRSKTTVLEIPGTNRVIVEN